MFMCLCVWIHICHIMVTIFETNTALWIPNAPYGDQRLVSTDTDVNFGWGIKFRTNVGIEFGLVLRSMCTSEVNFSVSGLEF